MNENYPSIDVDQSGLIDPAVLLDAIKHKEREMSIQEATIETIGSLSAGANLELWRGNISVEKRLEDSEISQDELDANHELIGQFFVPVSRGAAERCVDGSKIEGYDANDANWNARPLGPQYAGGTVGAARSLRRYLGPDSSATIATDIDKLLDEYPRHFAPGNHTDDQSPVDRTGCGNEDYCRETSLAIVDPKSGRVIKDIADAIMASGNLYVPGEAFAELQKNTKAILKEDDYFLPAQQVISKIEALNPNGIETLVRPHTETTLTVNWKTGTTFNRDAYNAATDSKTGNFNLDAWAIFEEYGLDIGYAMIVDAVATLMQITDGSQLLLVRQ